MRGTIFPDLGGADCPHDATILQCPASTTNWIDLEYLYEDGTGVSGAAYVVQCPHGGEPGGTVLAEGVLDSQGKAHVPLPLGVEQVEVYFHNDPAGTPYEDPEAARAAQEPDPGFFRRLWNGTCDAADWVGGVVAGDFKEDPSTSQIIVNTILTMIPGLDQLGDARDIIANLKKLLWDRRWHEGAVWLGVLLCLIGLIPTLGSLAKGIVRTALREASKLADLLAVFNFFKKGNGVRWLREFARQLPTDHAAAAAKKLTELLDRAMEYLRRARNGWFTPPYLRQPIDKLLDSIREVKTLAPQKLREAAEEVSRKITQALKAGLSRIIPSGVRRRLQLRQVKMHPPGGHSDKYGKFKNKSDVPSHYRNDPRFDSLSADPDHAGKITSKTRQEAMAGLEAEQQGLVKKPIERGPRGIEFYDGDGIPYDVKAPPSPPANAKWKFDAEDSGGSILDELREPNFPNKKTGQPEPRRVILDSAYMNQADHQALWDYLRNNATQEELGRISEINTRL